jgi:cobalt/nickel transport protein
MAVLRARPELVAGTGGGAGAGGRGLAVYGLLVALGLVVFVAPFACPWPDGLEAVAKRLGFAHASVAPLLKGPASDYRVPFIGSVAGATAVAGMIGALLAFVGAYGLARLLAPELEEPKKDAPSGN